MTTNSAPPSKKPSHRAYRVRGDGDAAQWSRIGAAWAHKDGKGYSIELEALPIDGRVVLRVDEPQEQKPAVRRQHP